MSTKSFVVLGQKEKNNCILCRKTACMKAERSQELWLTKVVKEAERVLG
jgi:hypothetical protein